MGFRFAPGWFLFVAVCFVWPPSAAAQPLSFARDDAGSVAGARGIVVADLNRDGWPDVATANTGRNSVAILLNHDGTLSKTLEIPVGTGPFDITSGDFDRDGKPDLAVTNADSNSVTVLYGAGDGTFPRSRLVTFNASVQSPRGIRAADVNGDGIVDLVITAYNSNTVMTLLGDGTGGFPSGPGMTGYAPHPQGEAIGDFNHDGKADIAVAYDSSGGLAVMYGNGTANLFAAPQAVGGPQNLNVVAAEDFNRDGWLDVAAASTSNSQVAVFLGGPSGLTFNKSYAVGSSPRGIGIADVNGDGALDILTANYGSSTVSVLLGSKSAPGTFSAATDFASGAGSRAIAVADVNNDSRLDVITGDQNAAVATVLVNQMLFKPAAFSFTKTSSGGSSTFGGGDHVEIADFNHDGKPDMATRGPNVDIYVYLAGGATVSLVPNAPYQFDRWMVGDFNGDGNADVLAWTGNPSTTFSLFLGDGHGNFGKVQTTSPLSVGPAAPGDMNGDGRPDLVFAGYDHSAGSAVLGVFTANRDGTFALASKMFTSTSVSSIAVGDFNLDGKNEVAAMTWPGGLTIWSDYSPSQGFRSAHAYGLSLPNIASQIAFGDVNHDGWPDLVLSTDMQTAVMLGGQFNFRDAMYFDQAAVGGSVWQPAVADINMDGNPDIVTDQGVVVFGNGDGTFQAPLRFDFGLEPEGASVFDVDADGLPDLIVAGSWSQIIVLYNSRNDVNHPPTVTAGPDIAASYADQFGEESIIFCAMASDPDAHAISYVWRDQDGKAASTTQCVYVWPPLPPGTYTFTVTASDGRGASATDSMTLTINPVKEIVIWAADGWPQGDAWTDAADTTAAGGSRAYNPNKNAAKIAAPLASPSSYYTIGFIADPTQTYKLWVRLKADGNSPYNDSVWVQFSGSTDSAGNPAYRMGTTSGLAVNLEECLGCGESGWGWEDDGWGSVDKNGVTLRFPDGGFHEIVIQQREDGVSIDQIVLSAEKYLTARPGTAKNDHTILTRTYVPDPD